MSLYLQLENTFADTNKEYWILVAILVSVMVLISKILVAVQL